MKFVHFWNERVEHFAVMAGGKSWSQSVCTHCWKFERYVACLPAHRWVRNVYWLGLLLGLAMPDILQTVGIKNSLRIVDTKILEIGWMRLKTSTGGNLLWTTSSTSAGFECKLNFLYTFSNLFTFHFLFRPVPNGARHFLAYRLDSTRLGVLSHGLDTCFKQVRAEIQALTYSTIGKQRHGLSMQIARFLRTTKFVSKIALHFFTDHLTFSMPMCH